MRNKSQPVKMGVLTLEDETGGHLPAASATVDPELGDHLPIPNLVVPSRSPLTVEISLTADNNHRSLEHTSISSNTSPELEGSVSYVFFSFNKDSYVPLSEVTNPGYIFVLLVSI